MDLNLVIAADRLKNYASRHTRLREHLLYLSTFHNLKNVYVLSPNSVGDRLQSDIPVKCVQFKSLTKSIVDSLIKCSSPTLVFSNSLSPFRIPELTTNTLFTYDLAAPEGNFLRLDNGVVSSLIMSDPDHPTAERNKFAKFNEIMKPNAEICRYEPELIFLEDTKAAALLLAEYAAFNYLLADLPSKLLTLKFSTAPALFNVLYKKIVGKGGGGRPRKTIAA
jgi:hypothetical protein